MKKQKIKAYIDEYKLVTDKITSLSMKFSDGSYVISISLVVGVASINMSTDSLFKNGIFIVLPIVVLFYLYNHIRYMVLQFKLSGYARALEEKINEMSEDNILLWENSIARENNQNMYEAFFMGIIYTGIFILMFYGAYYNLAIVFYGKWKLWPALFLIVPCLYYFFVFFIIIFIILFIQEHDRIYKKATSIYTDSIILDKKDNVTAYNVIVEEEKNDKFLKMRINIDKSAITSDKRSDKNESMRSSKKMSFCTILIVLLSLLIFIPLFPLMFFSKYSVDTVGKTYDYIIVLGNKSKDEMSEDMKCRLDCLLKYIENSPNATIIVSGGDGEADKMKGYLLEQGISDDSIILEEYSTNTRENLKNTHPMVTGNVLVITSDYHVFRTKLLCKKLYLEWDILPAKSESCIIGKAITECICVWWEFIGLGVLIPLILILSRLCVYVYKHISWLKP